MNELTNRQKQVLDFIAKRQEENCQTPTLHEIREHFGLSAIGTVQDHLEALEEKKYIKRGRKARAITLSAKSYRLLEKNKEKLADNIVRLPILGQVAAGRPLLSEENQLGVMDIDRSLVKSQSAFLLRVEGESMIEAHIQDGDYVLIRPQKQVETGQIAVALVDGEATVKRFYARRDGKVCLNPENSTMDAIVVDGNRVEIVGKVTGVIRSYN